MPNQSTSFWAGGVLLGALISVAAETNTSLTAIRRVTLEECVETALLQNRALQIERLNPAIVRSQLAASYGYYDPVFTLDTSTEESKDTGGFDPADFSRDAIFEAESEVARSGLTGFLPGGLSYTFSGGYAHSEGIRNGLNFESYSLLAGVTIRQPLLRNFWIDQGRMTIRVNRKNLQISELGVRAAVMDIINRVQIAYYELAGTLGEERVRRDLLEVRQRLLASTQRRIELGTMTVLEERLAAAQVAEVETDLNLAANAVRLAEHELKFLLGDSWTNTVNVRLIPIDRLLVLPGEFDLPTSWQRGLDGRPDLAQFRREVEKMEIDLKFRRNQLFPSLDLVAAHSRRGASTDQLLPPLRPSASLSAAGHQIGNADAPSDMVGIVFSVPLSRATERGNYRASRHAKKQAELQVRQFEEQVLREISDAVHTARSGYERVGLTRRARELAEAALKAEEQKLAGGKSTLFFVLQLQNDLATVRSAENRARVDYNQALSQLHFAEASLLDRLSINVDVR